MVDFKTNPIGWLKENVDNIYNLIATTSAEALKKIRDEAGRIDNLKDRLDELDLDISSAVDIGVRTAQDFALEKIADAEARIEKTQTGIRNDLKDISADVVKISETVPEQITLKVDEAVKPITGNFVILENQVEVGFSAVNGQISDIWGILTDPETFIEWLENMIEQVW